MVDTSYALPAELTEAFVQSKPRENQEIIGDVERIGTSGGKMLTGNTWLGAGQYSISGWFKYMPSASQDEDTSEPEETEEGDLSPTESSLQTNSEC